MRDSIRILLLAVVVATAATSGHATLIINEIHADPDTVFGDANRDGLRSSSQDEFIEVVNAATIAADLGGWTLADAVAVRHRFAADTRLAPWQAVVVFGGGAPSGDFGGALIELASTGSLSLNNSGDTLRLRDTAGEIIAQVTYGSAGGHNASLTRHPDLWGAFALHTTVADTRFSPGTLSSGSVFSSVPEPGSFPITLLGVAAIALLRHLGSRGPRSRISWRDDRRARPAGRRIRPQRPHRQGCAARPDHSQDRSTR